MRAVRVDIDRPRPPVAAHTAILAIAAVRSFACAAIVAAWASPAVVHAERVVALPTQSADARAAAQVDDALREALQKRDDVELGPKPALDLEAVQLALDCVGETPRCLGEVAERSDAEVLIAPSLKKRGDALELRVLRYDARGERVRYAARRELGRRPMRALAEAVPAIVDELFEAPAEPEAEAEPEPEPEPAPEAEETDAVPEPGEPLVDEGPSDKRPLPTGPLVVAGGGALLVAAGFVVGAVMKDTQDQYQNRSVTNDVEAREADSLRERGEREALIANVLFGVGGAALLAGGVWLGLELAPDRPDATAVVPELGPDYAGLRVAGRWSSP